MISDMALLHPETQITLCIDYCYHKFPSRTYWGNLCRARAGKLIINSVIIRIHPENLDFGNSEAGPPPGLTYFNSYFFPPCILFI